MESDHPEPVIRNTIAGFFIAVLSVIIPLYAISTDRVKSTHQGLLPKNGSAETSIKRSLPNVDAGHCLRIPS